MIRTIEQIAGEPDGLRLTVTDDAGKMQSFDMTLEEADELGRDLVVMAHRLRRSDETLKNYIS